MSEAVTIELDVWRDRLEVNTELALRHFRDDAYVKRWVDHLTPRQRKVLVRHSGVPDGTLAEQRNAILARRGPLLQLFLADEFAFRKRRTAIVDAARQRLSPSDLECCRVGDDAFDRQALVWYLFLADPENLDLVLRLHHLERRGFARMVLAGAISTVPTAAPDFFTVSRVQAIIDVFDRADVEGRLSHCAAVLADGGDLHVFIKRDFRPSHIARGAVNTFGFAPEWIILIFSPDLRRLSISSLSPDVSATIANLLASACFDASVSYSNASEITPASTVSAYLDRLCDQSASTPLLELTFRNAPLDGSPQLRFNDTDDVSVVPALLDYAQAFGNPLEHVIDIESIKVHASGKRVKIKFDAPDDSDGFVVRYGDQPLSTAERREFENTMFREHRIVALSTEKRNAR